MTASDASTVSPSALCAKCGHVRGEHETVERQWCARCAMTGSMQEKANHLFEPRDGETS